MHPCIVHAWIHACLHGWMLACMHACTHTCVCLNRSIWDDIVLPFYMLYYIQFYFFTHMYVECTSNWLFRRNIFIQILYFSQWYSALNHLATQISQCGCCRWFIMIRRSIAMYLFERLVAEPKSYPVVIYLSALANSWVWVSIPCGQYICCVMLDNTTFNNCLATVNRTDILLFTKSDLVFRSGPSHEGMSKLGNDILQSLSGCDIWKKTSP